MSGERKSRTTAFLERVGLKERDPREMLKEWSKEIRQEQRALDRQIREIEREEIKMKRDLKALAAKREREAMVPLAKSLVQSKKAKERIHVAKAHMNGALLELRHQVAQVRMSQVLESSTKMMATMNRLQRLNLPAMQKLAYEMEKAGLIEEMMDDAMENVMEDVEDEADAEVEAVITELTLGILDNAPSVPTRAPPRRADLAETGRRLFQESLTGSDDGRVLVGAGDGDGELSDLDRRMAALQS